jgi:hypothetical protein
MPEMQLGPFASAAAAFRFRLSESASPP